MRLLVLGLLLVGIGAGQTICGRRTSEADVYCVPDMRPFGTMFTGPRVQLWVRYDHPLSQTFFVRLEYIDNGSLAVAYKLMDGHNGLAAVSFEVQPSSVIRIEYYDFRRWYRRQINP